MQLSYGNYLFDTESVVVDAETTMVIDAPGMPPRARHDKCIVSGWLSGSSQDDITSASLALNAALNVPYLDLIFRDDSDNVTEVHLYSWGSTSGVQLTKGPVYNITPPATLKATNQANRVTARAFTFTMEATYPLVAAGTAQAGGVPFGGSTPGGGAIVQGQGTGWIPAPAAVFPGSSGGGGGPSNIPTPGGSFGGIGARTGAGAGTGSGFSTLPGGPVGQIGAGIPAGAAAVVIRFSESVRYTGGGPKFVFLPALNDVWQKQLVYPSMPYDVTQQGTATGWLTWPAPPNCISPADLTDSPDFVRQSPKRNGLSWEEFTITWTYRMKSISPISGLPNVYKL